MLMLTLSPLAVVVPHELKLLSALLVLEVYAPTCRALIDPPKAFAPSTIEEETVATQLKQGVLLMITFKSLAVKEPHELPTTVKRFPEPPKLQEDAPMYRAFIDPP